MTTDIHVCDFHTMDYQYIQRNGHPFLHRIVCECGRYWSLRLFPDRYNEGKMVGMWHGQPRVKPDFEDRYCFSCLVDFSKDYFDEDYDPDRPKENVPLKPPVDPEVKKMKDEVYATWKDWRSETGGFNLWRIT